MKKKFRGEWKETIGIHVGMILIVAALFFPISILLITSLSRPEDVQIGWGWSFPPSLESHIKLWQDSPMAVYAFNSLVIAAATVVIALSVSILAAHALARYRFPGRSLVFVSILTLFLIPSLFLGIPLFLMFRAYGLLDTRLGLILAHSTFTIPFLVWMLKNYMETVPKEIEESAVIDGANRLQVIIHVVIPLAAPAIFAMAIFAFLGSYHQFALNFVLVTEESLSTIPIGAMRYRGVSGDWISFGQIAAYTIESAIPPILFLLLTSKYIVQGLTAGFGKA